MTTSESPVLYVFFLSTLTLVVIFSVFAELPKVLSQGSWLQDVECLGGNGGVNPPLVLTWPVRRSVGLQAPAAVQLGAEKFRPHFPKSIANLAPALAQPLDQRPAR